jgi:hypothetical protein
MKNFKLALSVHIIFQRKKSIYGRAEQKPQRIKTCVYVGNFLK